MKLRQLQELTKDNPNPEIAVKYLVEKGMEPHIASGLVGNLMQESYMLENVWAKGNVDNKGSYGIMQWHGDRLTNLYNFEREKYNKEYKDNEKISLLHQLDYIVEVDSKRKVKAADGTMTDYEIKNYDYAYSQPDVEKAALAFSNKVIRPHEDYAHNDKRVKYAKELYEPYKIKKEKAQKRKKRFKEIYQAEMDNIGVKIDNTYVKQPMLKFDEGGPYPNMNKDLVIFRKKLEEKFPKIRFTSGYREGSKTSSGTASRHSKGEAWDIENNPEVYDYLWNTKEGLELLNELKLGVLDETNPETVKRTGATGAHFHIGRDSTLIPLAQKRYQQFISQQKNNNQNGAPSLATQPFNGGVNYATLPEKEQKKDSPLTEKDIRKILEEDRQKQTKQQENSFIQKYQQTLNPQQEQEYDPQLPQEDLSYLYNYIRLGNDDFYTQGFANGGSLENNCGGPGQPPCKERNELSSKDEEKVLKYIKQLNSTTPLEINKTANNLSNMWGNFSQYMFGNKDNDLKKSDYKPTIEKQKNFGEKEEKYYSRPGMREDVYNDLTSDRVKKDYNHDGTFNDIYKGLKSNGEDREHNADNAFPKNAAGYKGQYNRGHGSLIGEFNLGRYRTDAGEDENGRYISFVDKYDWNGFKTENAINFYDRIYENQWEEFKKSKEKFRAAEELKAKKKIERLTTMPLLGNKL